MNSPVWNEVDQCNQPFEEAVDNLYYSFESCKRNDRHGAIETWREMVKNRYPYDWQRLLVAVSDKCDAERRVS